jgi:signal transduction histidine kinase
VPGASPAAPLGYVVLEGAERHPPSPPFATLLIVLLVGALGAAAAVVGRSLARPLERLARMAQAFGAGDLGARTGLARQDELGAVARAFDEMAGRVEKLVLAQTELHANVAHELRTPLARIRLALELAESGDPGVARESLAEIAQDLAELEGLVDDILASARMDLARGTASLGAPPLHRATLDVAQVVGGSAERLRHRHPDRALELELEPALPPVEGDAVLLRRALDNLLDNAAKYSDGAVGLRIEPNGTAISFAVVDHGIGMTAEELERAGTPFWRSDASRTRKTGGVGLGLALARRIARAHGGDIKLASKPGDGTTARLEIPYTSPKGSAT